MVKIKYAGDKPVISADGVYFIGKRDKYIYLEPIVQIINQLENFHPERGVEKTAIQPQMTNSQIVESLYRYIPEFDMDFRDQIVTYEQHLNEHEHKTIQIEHLNDEEQRILKKNYISMHDYLIQRATNKLVYEKLVDCCVGLIHQKNVDAISVPFSIKYLHVIESISAKLSQGRNGRESNMKITAEYDKSTILWSFSRVQ